MSKVRVNSFSISVDGCGAGPNQDRQNPLGVNGDELHEWYYPANAFPAISGGRDGAAGVDQDFAKRGMENIGAWILGRNMFGPIRGPWPDETWRGWWGDKPPYHVPVFVLTHHPRASLTMEGGTTFHFVTDGIHAALDRARAAADGKDIRIGGGVSVLRQYFQAKLIDEAHIAVSPVFLGAGEALFEGLDVRALGYRIDDRVIGAKALHLVMSRS